MVQEVNAAVAPTLPPWVWACYYFCIAIGLAITVMVRPYGTYAIA